MIIGLRFGALAPRLSEQAEHLDLRFKSNDELQRLQKAVDSMTYLKVHGLLTQAEGRKVAKRLTKEILKAMEPKP